MTRNSLFVLSWLCLLFASLFRLLFAVRGESSFLNDAEIIKRKVPGFVDSVPKNGLEVSKEYMENVYDKEEAGPPRDKPPQTGPIVLPTRNKIPVKNLHEFDVAKVEVLEEEIQHKLGEIKQKIESLKDIALQYGEDAAESTPLLGFPTKFGRADTEAEEEDSSSQLPVDAKTQRWVQSLNLEDGPEQCEHTLSSANAAPRDPKRSQGLAGRPRTLPNWKGSARHLVRGGTIKEELFSRLDDEGRSIVAEFEKAEGPGPLPGEHSEQLPPTERATDSVLADPEDLSAQENGPNSKLILTNEIPSGQVLAENDFVYQGNMFSNSKQRQNCATLLSSPEKVDYTDSEDLKDDEPKVFVEEKKQTKKTRKARSNRRGKNKTKDRVSVERRDFSPPEVVLPLSPDPENTLVPVQIAPSVPRRLEGQKKSRPETPGKAKPVFGYEDLQFELSEGTLPSPMLPSIESDGAEAGSFSMRRNAMGPGAGRPQSGKRPSRRDEPRGYSELPDLSEEASLHDRQPDDAQLAGPVLYPQIFPKEMPKRSKKKLHGSFVSPPKTLGAPKAKPPSRTVGKTLPKAGVKPPKPDAGGKTLGEAEPEMFDKSLTFGSGGFSPVQTLGDLMCAETGEQKIKIPKSNLPKRKNK